MLNLPFTFRSPDLTWSDLIDPARLNDLGPGKPNSSLQRRLASLSIADLAPGRTVKDPSMGEACLAGLWLLHDFLDESHRISQEIDTPTGSCWHAILHRREPDYGNSKYWFRRVGEHPVFVPLSSAARQLASQAPHNREIRFLAEQSAWDPYRFVDLCESVAGTHAIVKPLCQAVQAVEWHLLFDHCYRSCFGESVG